MEAKVIIAADSTCDLGAELAQQYGVRILPLGISLGDQQYTDGVDITPDMIYAHYARTGELPKTAAINIGAFQDFFTANTPNGEELVFFTISSSMSSTWANARIAAAEMENVYVVDTANLSTGGGLLVLAAAEMARQDMGARDIAKACEALAKRVDASFVVDDLEFIHKGGRCSAVAMFGANLLQLKPCISVKDGAMGVGKKYRGKFAAVLEKYIVDRLGDGSQVGGEQIFVTHAGCDEALVERCADLVRQLVPGKQVPVTRAGCTISSHCGRNTLGVLFIRNEE